MKIVVLPLLVAAVCSAVAPAEHVLPDGSNQWPAEPGVFELPDFAGLVSPETILAFDRKTGDLVHLIHRPSAQEFACQAHSPLFFITLVDPSAPAARAAQSGASRPESGPASSDSDGETTLDAYAFRRVGVEKSSDTLLRLTFGNHPRYDLSVEATAQLEKGAIRLRLSVRNGTKLAIRRIMFPHVLWSPVLGEDASDDRLLVPWNDGQLVAAPGQTDASWEADYPGMAIVQFTAYYDRKAGVYLAAEDASGYPKRWQRRSVARQQVAMNLLHLFEESPGKNVAIPYDVVLRTFEGDWRDAAAIYKSWAVKQPWCVKKLAERNDVPMFLKEGAGIVIKSGFQNAEATDREFGKDLEGLPEFVQAYRKKTGLAHIVFVPYGWENRGTWAGINYFPARPSDEAWAQTALRLRKNGDRLMFLPSGFWWVVKRQDVGIGPAFDDSAQIKQFEPMLAKNPDGTPWSLDCYDITKKPGQIWRGLSMHLCHGSPEAQETMKDIFLRAARLGATLLSFDQEQGAAQRAPCYDPSHGHGRGFGPYIWTGFRRTCEMILAEGKTINSELGLCMEDVSELAIPYMATYWSRQFKGGFDEDVPPPNGCPNSVGLFSYIYHEFTTAIGAACVQGQGEKEVRPPAELRCFILSNNLCRGLVPGPFVHDVPLDPKDEWHRMVARAFFSYCQPYARFPEYLVLGEAVRPPTVACATAESALGPPTVAKPETRGGAPKARRPVVTFPAVNAGSFKAATGSIGTVVANTTNEDESATLTIPWKTAHAVLYDSARKELMQWRDVRMGQQIRVTLEPFGTRMLVVD